MFSFRLNFNNPLSDFGAKQQNLLALRVRANNEGLEFKELAHVPQLS